MKPTAEMVERAEDLSLTFGLTAEIGERRVQQIVDAIAQALADEHERAMERAAAIADDFIFDERVGRRSEFAPDAAAAVRDIGKAIRAATFTRTRSRDSSLCSSAGSSARITA